MKVYELNANGQAINPMMAVKVLRHSRLIAQVAVTKEQLAEIERLYLIGQKKPAPQEHFLGFKLTVDPSMPKDEIQFHDSDGQVVGKITNLGRSRAIPVEEISKK